METFLNILNIVLITFFSWWYWRKQELPLRKFYWHGLAAKLSAGLLVGIIYASVYSTGDTISLFEEAKELSQLARTDFDNYLDFIWSGGTGQYYSGTDRTIFFVKILSFFAIITYESYWVTALYLSLFSFLAAWHLVKVIWTNEMSWGIPAAIAFLFFPSCVFWASGIMKETLAMAGLYFLAALFLRFWWKQKITVVSYFLALLAIWIIWNLKYYYIGLFLPVIFSIWVTRKITEAKKIEKFSAELAIMFSILVLGILAASLVHPNFSFTKILNVLVSNYEANAAASRPDNIITYHQLEASWVSILQNSPWALVSGMFRPFVWEADGALKFFIAIENLVLLVLVLISLFSFFDIKTSPYRTVVIGLLIYSVVLCIFLAISTPNFGTLARYRIGFLPFLLFLLMNRPMIVRRLAKLFNVHIPGLSY